MKKIFEPVMIILGVINLISPFFINLVNGNNNLGAFIVAFLIGAVNSIIYLAVIFLYNEMIKNKKKIEELEKRLDVHYESLKSLKIE
jgi:hypothetical protein